MGVGYPFQALLPSSYRLFKTHGLVNRKVQRASLSTSSLALIWEENMTVGIPNMEFVAEMPGGGGGAGGARMHTVVFFFSYL